MIWMEIVVTYFKIILKYSPVIREKLRTFRIAGIPISNILHLRDFRGLSSVLKRICGPLRKEVTADRRKVLN
jgi:hypothetical protein